MLGKKPADGAPQGARTPHLELVRTADAGRATVGVVQLRAPVRLGAGNGEHRLEFEQTLSVDPILRSERVELYCRARLFDRLLLGEEQLGGRGLQRPLRVGPRRGRGPGRGLDEVHVTPDIGVVHGHCPLGPMLGWRPQHLWTPDPVQVAFLLHTRKVDAPEFADGRLHCSCAVHAVRVCHSDLHSPTTLRRGLANDSVQLRSGLLLVDLPIVRLSRLGDARRMLAPAVAVGLV
mmetsp:Transcript_91550/g.262205  ORF Transcript_91550/g.262205 Transcript_91550/m.262205 type:complete len:234 (+) Transcript_91550:293-994(+)